MTPNPSFSNYTNNSDSKIKFWRQWVCMHKLERFINLGKSYIKINIEIGHTKTELVKIDD